MLNEPVRAETDSWNREEREDGRSELSQERERESAAKLNLKFPPCFLPLSSFPLLGRSVGSLIRFPNGVSAIERHRHRRPKFTGSLRRFCSTFFAKPQTLGRDKLQREILPLNTTKLLSVLPEADMQEGK